MLVGTLRARLQALVDTNRLLIRQGGVPDYIETLKRMSYAPDPIVNESLRTAAQLASASEADIQELTAWRLAELLESGENARIEVVAFFHNHSPLEPQSLLIVRGDGRFENPLAPSNP